MPQLTHSSVLCALFNDRSNFTVLCLEIFLLTCILLKYPGTTLFDILTPAADHHQSLRQKLGGPQILRQWAGAARRGSPRHSRRDLVHRPPLPQHDQFHDWYSPKSDSCPLARLSLAG